MNIDRMLKVAKAIEQDDLNDRNVGFDMHAWIENLPLEQIYGGLGLYPIVGHIYPCKTTACIAGHACIMFGMVGTVIGSGTAQRILGLDDWQAESLFMDGRGYVLGRANARLSEITREQAVAAIRRMVREEGEQAIKVEQIVQERELVCV